MGMDVKATRKAIPVAIKRAVLARSGGMCEAQDCDRVGKEFEHRVPVALNGKNTEENIWLACKTCHRKKTSEQDLPRIAKANRQAGKTGQRARRERAKAAGTYSGIPSPKDGMGKKRGFSKTHKRRFDGSVVRRD